MGLLPNFPTNPDQPLMNFFHSFPLVTFLGFDAAITLNFSGVRLTQRPMRRRHSASHQPPPGPSEAFVLRDRTASIQVFLRRKRRGHGTWWPFRSRGPAGRSSPGGIARLQLPPLTSVVSGGTGRLRSMCSSTQNWKDG